MATALAVLSCVVVAVVGWILAHNSQCSRLRERVAALEQWKKDHDTH